MSVFLSCLTKSPAVYRAAQFAPFAALIGYEDSIKETPQANESLFEEK